MRPLQDAFGDASQGVERHKVDVYVHIPSDELQDHNRSGTTEGHDQEEDVIKHTHRRGSIRLAHKAAKKIHDVLTRREKHNADSSNDHSTDNVPILAPSPPQDAAHDRLGPLLEEKPNIPPAKEFVRNPLSATKQIIQRRGGDELAQNIAKSEITHGASVALVRENEKVQEARNTESVSCDVQHLEQLKQLRQDSFTRWTIDRHVRNIGRIEAQVIPLKRPREFTCRDKKGVEIVQWKQYAQHLHHSILENYTRPRVEADLKFPDPTRELLASSLERVLVVSKPLQSLTLALRRVSRWENPLESVLYALMYFSLVFSNSIAQMMIILVFGGALHRRLCPPTIDEMHARLERIEDKHEQAQDLSELITKYGTHGWIDRLIDVAGPVLLHHIEGLGDMLEVMQNFYEWRNPWQTFVTLCRLLLLFAVITTVTTELLVRGCLLTIGFVMFAATPLTELYPRYRSLTSPFTWLFWRVPTHADWAIARLQAEAEHQLQTLHSKSSVSQGTDSGFQHDQSFKARHDDDQASSRATVNVGKFKCKSDGPGELIVTTDYASFSPTRNGFEAWTLPYEQIKRIHKVSGSGGSAKKDGLLFITKDKAEYRVTGLANRNEVFSQIVGYSNVQWKKTG